MTEDDQEITRKIAVEPTDTVKYYREEDGYYTLAVYDNTGAIKSKGYTMHSDNVPNISVNYNEDVNNNFTTSDEYNGYVALTEVDYSADTEFVVTAGVTKIEYSAGDSGARIAEVEEGDILKYTADPNDSTKFTLTVYDKDKNKKRDLYTWNNDNLHFSYGTAKGHNAKNSESGYEDVSVKIIPTTTISCKKNWTVPDGVTKLKWRHVTTYNTSTTKYGNYKLIDVTPGTYLKYTYNITRKSNYTLREYFLGYGVLPQFDTISYSTTKDEYTFKYFEITYGTEINNLTSL